MFAIVIKSSIDLHSGFIDCHWKYFRTELLTGTVPGNNSLLTGTMEIGLVSKGSPCPTNPRVVRTLRRRNFVIKTTSMEDNLILQVLSLLLNSYNLKDEVIDMERPCVLRVFSNLTKFPWSLSIRNY